MKKNLCSLMAVGMTLFLKFTVSFQAVFMKHAVAISQLRL